MAANAALNIKENSSGTRTSSKTLWTSKEKDGSHIDVENPGTREGQIHFQDSHDNKYYYNPKTGNFDKAPNSINKRAKKDVLIQRAIQTGL